MNIGNSEVHARCAPGKEFVQLLFDIKSVCTPTIATHPQSGIMKFAMWSELAKLLYNYGNHDEHDASTISAYIFDIDETEILWAQTRKIGKKEFKLLQKESYTIISAYRDRLKAITKKKCNLAGGCIEFRPLEAVIS